MTSFGWFFFFISVPNNLGMMLALDYASCYAARSTLVMLVANNVQKSGFKSY